MSVVSFEVLGNPAPQGSKKHVGNGVMVESSKQVRPWRQDVAAVARDVTGHDDIDAPLDGALRLQIEFRFPMPKSRKAAVRRAGIAAKTTSPDLDKLVRSTCDALESSGLIANDARICKLVASKVEVAGWTGAEIVLETVES